MRHEQVLRSKNSKSLCRCGGQAKSIIRSSKYFAEGKQRDNDANEIQKHCNFTI